MKAKAIALISGGLDSLLAARVMMEQGIEVYGVCFVMSFASRDIDKFKEQVTITSSKAGITVRMVDISDDFLKIFKNPKYGYGANLNPCIDCKILMLKKAKEIMEEQKADFVVTGEVLGERPMSQRRDALNIIQKCSELNGYLLRPLSAKILEETIPEKEGKVNREKLYGFSGRGRTNQFELAKKFGITEYFTPAGGCLLTDPNFSWRLKDLMRHEGLKREDIKLLKYGRHFRLDDETKVIVGRDEGDNENILLTKSGNDILMNIKEKNGPYVLLRGNISDANIRMAASLCVSHSKYKDSAGEIIEYWQNEDDMVEIEAVSLNKKEIEKRRVGK
ncbi:MAG: tRNA 4-thiouridine(8) synthase ThiI [Candidatus Tantalella remota]|nr:tRNA 4-thiouridine(8) synthase ThiI [Candidatus Tantalella remota]